MAEPFFLLHTPTQRFDFSQQSSQTDNYFIKP